MLRLHYSSDEQIIECGCDEAGRGCLAGPVVAAAVILPPDYRNELINDSKQLSRRVREQLRTEIEREAVAHAVVFVSAEEIDEINILAASIAGMNRAVQQLAVTPQLLLIDGNRFKNETGIPYHCIVKGDATFMNIAAASILAKTYRDELMMKLDAEFPVYMSFSAIRMTSILTKPLLGQKLFSFPMSESKLPLFNSTSNISE